MLAFGHEQLDWPRNWWPLANVDQYYLIALVDRGSNEESAVLDLFLQDDATLFLPSIEALVGWHLECLRAGVHVWRRDEGSADHAAQARLRQRWRRPVSVDGVVLPERVSTGFTRDWPPSWRESLGIVLRPPAGADTTIAALLSGASERGVISGRMVTGAFGPNDASIDIDDRTGRAWVGCPRGTPGVRELGVNFVVELVVRRPTLHDRELGALGALLGPCQLVAEEVRWVRSLRAEDR